MLLLNGGIPFDFRIAKDPVPQCEKPVITIPLKQAGRLLLIEAEIDGRKGNFIFDTGAPYLVLNKTYFRNYKKRNNATAGTITGMVAGVSTVDVETLSFQGVSYSNLDADLVSLGEIENARGVKILGLLGLNLFTSFEMEIDVRNSVLKLYQTDAEGECYHSPSDYECEITRPISVFDNTIFVECMIADKKLRFGFDSGAETNALSSRANKKVLETISITGRRKLGGVGNGSLEIIYGRMNDFKLGEETVLGMQTLITNFDGMSSAYGTSIDGMLGYDFMAKGLVRINCRKKFMKLCLFDKFSSE
jgi:hypothetical protein